MEERSLAKSLADKEGRMLMARIHAFTLPWESQETTSEGDYKQPGPAVCHSTGFLQIHNSHKDSSKSHVTIDVPFPGNMSFELTVFKATTVTKEF